MTNTELKLTSYGFALIVIRALGLYCLVLAISYGAQSFAVVFSETVKTSYIYLALLIPFLTYVVVFFLLWFLSPKIATMMTSAVEPMTADEGPWSRLDIWGLAFALVGLVTIIEAIPILLQFIVNLTADVPEEFAKEMRRSHRDTLIRASCQIIIGCYLLLGWRSIVTFLLKLRQAGRDR